jgi:hypothetical protein
MCGECAGRNLKSETSDAPLAKQSESAVCESRADGYAAPESFQAILEDLRRLEVAQLEFARPYMQLEEVLVPSTVTY